MASLFPLYSLLFFSLYLSLLPESLVLSQNITCNDILLSYTSDLVAKIPPNLTDSAKQPYKFESTLTVTNNGLKALKSWQVFVGFENDEYLYSASNAVLADGSEIPGLVGNGTVFAGYPASDLKTAWETAGDETLYSTQVQLSGSEFGSKDISMPKNISLANDGFICDTIVKQGNNSIQTCCKEDPNFKANTTTADDIYLPRQKGDLTIMYDVVSVYPSSYLAQVEIENHNQIGRLDYWQLSWDWMREEFIDNMKGAYTDIVDATACVDGPQGQQYQGTDFTQVLNCQRRPTIIDLPLDKTNDTALGMIPNCCRNGTILPKSMDATKSISAFQINVHKMPPDLNRTALYPPRNWKIEGTLNPDYVCGPPVRVSNSEYPDSSGLPVNKTAFASWQVVCNITKPKGSSPKCCVSFSAYYNESVVPCNTCACGCSSASSQSCSATSPALLLPSQALLVPFENRTTLVTAWSQMNHRTIPNPMPCGDNCGVSINWHLYTDYTKGWTARMTVFNWGETPFADWFAAVQLDNAGPGFEKAYSFNGTSFINGNGDKNNSIFMQGLPGLNYIVAESDGKDPIKDPRVPGKQQSVISFTKKMTPGINVAAGDGFPTKVYFNGEECSLPSILPTSGASRKGVSVLLSIVLFFLLQLW